MKIQFQSGRSREARLIKLLIDQPRLDRAKVSDPRMRNLLDLFRDLKLTLLILDQ